MAIHLHFRACVCILAGASALAHAAPGAAAELRVWLEVSDLDENPITSIGAGQEFLLRTMVQDVRDPPVELAGVAAASVNVQFDPALAVVKPGALLEFDPYFNLLHTGQIDVPGQITSAGALSSSFDPPGNAPQLLWSIVMQATSPGTVNFAPSYDSDLQTEYLIYLRDDPVPESEIEFVGTTLTIVPEPSGLALAASLLVGLGATAGVRRWRRSARRRA